jgi:4-amino-4-deoxy-L-arabinose transferase-like glycosyltransferase
MNEPFHDSTRERSGDLWLLAVVALTFRAVIAWFYPPLITPDTASYLELADRIARLDFQGYQAMRTPVFPLLLLICGKIPALTAAAHHLLGIAECVLLYEIFRRVFRSREAGLLAGYCYALNPSQALMERALLSEPVTTILVTAAVFLLIRGLESGKERSLFASGALSGLAVLARPNFVFLPALTLAFAGVILLRRLNLFRAIRGMIAVSLPAAMILGGWVTFSYVQTGYAGLSALTGYSLINHAGAWIEEAPPGYETIRDIYLKHRAERLRLTGSQDATIFLAREELLAATGMNEIQLAQRLTELSERLIIRNPGAYLKSAARSLAEFWRPTWFTDEGGIRTVLRNGLSLSKVMLAVYLPLHLALSALFLLFPAAWPLRKKFPFIERAVAGGWRLTLVYLTVWATAVLQAAVARGDNGRYEQPVEPLVLAVGAYLAWQIAGRTLGRGRTGDAQAEYGR